MRDIGYYLDKAWKKAIDYACKYYHYSKSIPVNTHWYNVFFNSQWCWVILFWTWANNNIWKPFWLKQWQVIELVRIALNGKQSNVSEPLSIALKLIKKHVPLCKLIVSYADWKQWHVWWIYQATNRIYLWWSWSTQYIDPKDWKMKHAKTLNWAYWTVKWLKAVKQEIKHKYIYCLDKEIHKQMKKLWKEYPKNVRV